MLSQFHRCMQTVALLTLLGLFLACAGGNSKKEQEANKTESLKPVFSLTAENFTREFLADSKAAHTKYSGKVVEITGDVYTVDLTRWKEKSARICLESRDLNQAVKRDKSASVFFDLPPEYWNAATALSLKQKVKLTGKGVGWHRDHNWLGGSGEHFSAVLQMVAPLQELSKSDLVLLKATDLVKDFPKHAMAVVTINRNKLIDVSGEVEDFGEVEGFVPGQRQFTVKLKGDGERYVSATTESWKFEVDGRLQLKKSQTVRLRGFFDYSAFVENNALRFSVQDIVEWK